MPLDLIEKARGGRVPREVLVFAGRDGYLSEVECVYVDEPRDEWPEPDDLILWSALDPGSG